MGERGEAGGLSLERAFIYGNFSESWRLALREELTKEL